MVSNTFFTAAVVLATASQAFAHISLFTPAMWGYNHSNIDGNRPLDPMMNRSFKEWWFHGLMEEPPHPDDIFQLPVGQTVTTELACTRGATSYSEGIPGGDIRDPNDLNNPCPRSHLYAFHTNGLNDLGGCALAVAYKSNASDVKPEDFTVFSVNQTCVYYRFTDFQIPAQMPKCPNGKCICAWFWIHLADSGSEQNYMSPFQCNMQGATSTTPLPPAQVPRRCGIDILLDRPADPSNCTYGAKQPFYWFQAERNNMNEGTYTPPHYKDLYNFRDGAQNDIFDPAYYNNTLPHYNISTDTRIIPAPSPVLMKTFSGSESLNNNNTNTNSSSVEKNNAKPAGGDTASPPPSRGRNCAGDHGQKQQYHKGTTGKHGSSSKHVAHGTHHHGHAKQRHEEKERSSPLWGGRKIPHAEAKRNP